MTTPCITSCRLTRPAAVRPAALRQDGSGTQQSLRWCQGAFFRTAKPDFLGPGLDAADRGMLASAPFTGLVTIPFLPPFQAARRVDSDFISTQTNVWIPPCLILDGESSRQ